ncbi:hypothetical protein WDZ16_01435 [Pseudokineococcus marinus]|uniref:Uncharacterized protein n=1 Tax=Pseudokineococcus marinus TaxID=351215 RepID=A0A849BG09_9ACTN|nr:hypothetical protein [Pseudokineococcus marinus]NNH21491.1 hypothetical protein [Pseudokineococcus marinus]
MSGTAPRPRAASGTAPRSAHPAPSSPRKASAAGLGVAAVGVVVLNIAPFMNWVGLGADEEPRRTGYETDSLVPFMAYLGLGLLLAMVYARGRSDHGQHRGLTLVSMAVALAVTVQAIAFSFNPMGGLERGDDLSAQIGVYVAIVGAALWALGSGLLAKEIEGDDHDQTDYEHGADVR